MSGRTANILPIISWVTTALRSSRRPGYMLRRTVGLPWRPQMRSLSQSTPCTHTRQSLTHSSELVRREVLNLNQPKYILEGVQKASGKPWSACTKLALICRCTLWNHVGAIYATILVVQHWASRNGPAGSIVLWTMWIMNTVWRGSCCNNMCLILKCLKLPTPDLGTTQTWLRSNQETNAAS